MKISLICTALLCASLSSCSQQDQLSILDNQPVDSRNSNPKINSGRSARAVGDLSNRAGFNAFLFQKSKHTAADLDKLYLKTSAELAGETALPSLKHSMIYTLVKDYNLAGKGSKEQLLFYVNEASNLPEFDSRLILPLVKGLKSHMHDTVVKSQVKQLLSKAERSLASQKDMVITFSDPATVSSLKVESTAGDVMAAFVKDGLIESVKESYAASNELVSILKILPN